MIMQEIAARDDVYYPLHCYSLSHLVPSLLTSGSDMSSLHLADIASSQLRLVVYFIIEGSITALTTYFVSLGKGHPISFYRNSAPSYRPYLRPHQRRRREGRCSKLCQEPSYFTPPWVCYVLVVMLGVERRGVFKSVALGNRGLRCFVLFGEVSLTCPKPSNMRQPYD